MSALSSSAAPKPAFSPSPGLVPVPPPPRRAPWVLAAVVVVLATATGLYLKLRTSPASQVTNSIRTVRAVRGVLQQNLRLSGSISAKRFADIFAPMMQGPDAGRGLVLISLYPMGTHVKKGQTIAQIDGQSVADHVDDLTSQVSQTDMDLRRMRAQNTAETETFQQAVRAAKGKLDQAKQDMRASEIRSGIDRELLKLSLDEAQAVYDESLRDLPLVAERQRAQLRIAELGQEGTVSHRNRHRVDLSRFTIQAPIEGTVVMKTIRRNGEITQVRLGDELSPGQPFMRVIDPAGMQLDASMNQSESERVRLGQKAEIHFDAYPDIILHGRVAAVGALAVSGRRMSFYVRTVPVRIDIDGTDPRVIPDLTASADVTISSAGEGVIIPREALQENAGKQVVYVMQGDTMTPREVEVGGYNETQVSIVSGLQDGDQIALPSN